MLIRNMFIQDIFGIIPGDTDYQIFAKDNGDIQGLDIIFVLGGYFYHTSYDTIERLLYALGSTVIQILCFEYLDLDIFTKWVLILECIDETVPEVFKRVVKIFLT